MVRLLRRVTSARVFSSVVLLCWSASAVAQHAPLTISVDEGGGFVVATGEVRVWPMRDDAMTPAERPYGQRFEAHVVSQLFAAAAAGAEPAIWQVGFFQLFGWLGVPVDVERGKRALAWAPPQQRAVVSWALAQANLREGRLSLAEDHVLEAFDLGLSSATPRLCSFARNRSRTSRRPPRDLVRAEQLLSRVWPRATTNAECNLARSMIRYEQGRFDEAFDAASMALSGVDQTNAADLKQVYALRIMTGVRSGRANEIPLDEFTRLLNRPDARPWEKWAPWLVLGVSLLILIGWTWARRKRPVGLTLAMTWVTVAVMGNGLGLLLPLPLPLGAAGSRWAGALLSALACALAFRLRPPNGVLGNTARPIERSDLRLLGAFLVGAAAFSFLYEALWASVFGEPMKEQLVIAFFRVSGALEVAWTFAAVAVFIPYVEEVCFRGFLLEGLDARWGPRVAIVVSTLIFGFVHVELTQPLSKVPMTALFGLFLALMRRRTGDLRLSVVLHGTNNALAFLMIWTS